MEMEPEIGLCALLSRNSLQQFSISGRGRLLCEDDSLHSSPDNPKLHQPHPTLPAKRLENMRALNWAMMHMMSAARRHPGCENNKFRNVHCRASLPWGSARTCRKAARGGQWPYQGPDVQQLSQTTSTAASSTWEHLPTLQNLYQQLNWLIYVRRLGLHLEGGDLEDLS